MTDTWRAACALVASGLGVVVLQRMAMALSRSVRDGYAVSGWRRKPAHPLGDILAFVAGVQLAALFTLLTARPIMAVLIVLALIMLLVTVNMAKEKALHEPLVLADAWLLGQVFKYPHLYFPFFPTKKIATGLLIVCTIVAVLFIREDALPLWKNWNVLFLFCIAALPVLSLILMRRGHLTGVAKWLIRRCPVSHCAVLDALHNGPLTAALLHPVQAGIITHNHPDFFCNSHIRPIPSRFPESIEHMLAELENMNTDALPHVILVQAESFCDIRKYVSESLKTALADTLPNWDKLKAQGRAFDPPENAYGAYTMRTEFSMLTGLHQEDLGPWAFNPYLLAARQPLWSLARFFRKKGYDTLCIHPYYKEFFRRDKALPNLGFQKFLGIDDLRDLKKFGPYVSDVALGKKIQEYLTKAKNPVFCFAITMEAHGPWLKERLSQDPKADTVPHALHTISQKELEIYCMHIFNTDAMLAILNEESTNRKTRNMVFAYGDHLPAIF